MRGEDRGQRVDGGHQAFIAQVGAAVFCPSLPEGCRVGRVLVQALPPEGDEVVLALLPHDVVAAVHPRVGAPALSRPVVAEGHIGVPHHHLEARVHAVAALEEFAAQAVGVHVVAHLHHQLVVDERHHVQVAAVAVHGVAIAGRGQRRLHQVDLVLDVLALLGPQVLGVRFLVLEMDDAVLKGLAVAVHGMVFRNIGHLVHVVHLHQVAARERVALAARLAQIEAVLALRDDLGEHIHPIVGPVDDEFAVAPQRREFHPGPCDFQGQHVAYHALVGIGGQQRPVVVFRHPQDGDFLLLAATLQRFLQGAEGVGLLRAVVVGRVAAVAQGNQPLVVDTLPRVGRCVGIVEVPLAVVDDLHAGFDALRPHDGIAAYLNPHNGQVGRVEPHLRVVRREVARRLGATRHHRGQRHRQCRQPPLRHPKANSHFHNTKVYKNIIRDTYAVCGVMTPWMLSMYLARGSI